MKRFAAGILAHVDSGKTTLSEAMLYCSGDIRKLGRVDHKDAFLDTYSLERERGITIFSKQAVMHLDNSEVYLLDTPGHIDFSAETERTLQVLDYAILVINGSDGVQNHTRTLWKLLSHYNIPVFLFVNKMDMDGTYKETIFDELKKKLSSNIIDFSETDSESFFDDIAVCDEDMMLEFLENGNISDDKIIKCIKERKVFPCYFGSALKMKGVEEFLKGFDRYTIEKQKKEEFSAKVYKISEDDQGNRLTHMKITGGSLKVRSVIEKNGETQKINHLRIYSGTKFQAVDEVYQGMICAAAGLNDIFPGEGLGDEEDTPEWLIEPVLTYKAEIHSELTPSQALAYFKKLEAEEPKLHVVWNGQLKEIHVQVMGEIQLDVLKSIAMERFKMDVDFVHGNIAYKETIKNAVEGVGHYEPLKHYAEVHLVMEPLEQGRGLVFDTDCREEILDKNWQRLIMTHLNEKTHVGVLTGSPITDIKITLVSGRAHLKHTEGGDFRQATYRAVRHGLRMTESVLLEPWYEFTLELPSEHVGRAMADITRMDGVFSAPDIIENTAVIKGDAPVAEMRGYQTELTGYTGGKGILSLSLSGYRPCRNEPEVIESLGYNCDSDTENTCDSVFCSHGAGALVPWNEVYEHMHIPLSKRFERQEGMEDNTSEKEPEHKNSFKKADASEKELMAIFEMTYGKTDPDKSRNAFKTKKEKKDMEVSFKAKPLPKGPEYLLVDGYNIIFSWNELSETAKTNLDLARSLLINTMCNYQGVFNCEVIVVFDAYKIKGSVREVEKHGNISVVYTKEAETADTYIEKISHDLSKDHRVRVATSDGMEQVIILGNGAFRISASELYEEVKYADKSIKEFLRSQKK